MKKVINITLGNRVFSVEKPAYDRLADYLKELEDNLSRDPGKSEIIEDIEERMGELFHEICGEKGIREKDVEEVIAIMGQPADISGNFSEEDKYTGNKEWQEDIPFKKVYRNPDDKLIGGVCGGFGAYLNIDPLWIRLFFILLILVYVSGLLFYLVLWILIPKAKTPQEKMAMRGGAYTPGGFKKKDETVTGSRETPMINRFKMLSKRLIAFLSSATPQLYFITGAILILLAVIFITGLAGILIYTIFSFITVHQPGISETAYFLLVSAISALLMIPSVALLTLGIKTCRLKDKMKLRAGETVLILSSVAIFTLVYFITVNFPVLPSLNTSISMNTYRVTHSNPIETPESDMLYLEAIHDNNFTRKLTVAEYGFNKSKGLFSRENTANLTNTLKIEADNNLKQYMKEELYFRSNRLFGSFPERSQWPEIGIIQNDSVLRFNPLTPTKLDPRIHDGNICGQFTLVLNEGTVFHADSSLQYFDFVIFGNDTLHSGIENATWTVRNGNLMCIDCPE